MDINKKMRFTADYSNMQKLKQLGSLDEILKRQVIFSSGKAMMYFVTDKKEHVFMTRGKHCEQVAEIGEALVTQLGLGDNAKESVYQIGIAHDFGHSVLAHTGEVGIGRFLASPGEFQEMETKDVKLGELKVKDLFDHSKHGRKILEIICTNNGIEVSKKLLNGIEAHSSGSDAKGAVRCESIEAECIMRADKIASSISDTQDMLKSKVFKLDDGSLKKMFDDSQEVRTIIAERLFGKEVLAKYKKDGKAFDKMLELVIKYGGDEVEELRKIKDDPQAGNPKLIFGIFEEVIKNRVDQSIKDVKEIIKLPPEAQRENLIKLIVEENNGKELDVTTTGEEYKRKFPDGQLKVPVKAEGILAGFRGLLMSCENKRILGKMGCELEGLVETCARYVYNHQADFQNESPFNEWNGVKYNDKEIEWKDQVAYGIAQMTDRQFKDFCENLLEREDAREAFKKCKYRDPRDTKYMKEHSVKKLPFSECNFSTKESIEKAFTVDLNRTYQKPMYIQLAEEKKKEISGPER